MYYFGYHVNGYQLTKFEGELQEKKINKQQNFIISGKKGSKAHFTIPSDVNYESCYLIVELYKLDEFQTKTKSELNTHLSEIFSFALENSKYRYFGNIDLRTGIQTEIIVKNKRTDLVGRLLIEAAIMNMLASQIDSHDSDVKTESLQPLLTKTELSKIIDLGDYIQSNIGKNLSIETLSVQAGLAAKKLQGGMRFLYGSTVNEYVTNLRLEFARELLGTTDMNISEVCFRIGYNSRSYFSKVFKSKFGLLPSEYVSSLTKENLTYEVSYRSITKTGITTEEISDILEISRASNSKLDVTGCLIYHQDVFFQLIEGDKTSVKTIYDKIKNDERHTDVQLIWEGLKPTRDFFKWDMVMITDEGILQIPHEASTDNLSLGHLIGELNERSIAAKQLWRKVRNLLKVANKDKDPKQKVG